MKNIHPAAIALSSLFAGFTALASVAALSIIRPLPTPADFSEEAQAVVSSIKPVEPTSVNVEGSITLPPVHVHGSARHSSSSPKVASGLVTQCRQVTLEQGGLPDKNTVMYCETRQPSQFK